MEEKPPKDARKCDTCSKEFRTWWELCNHLIAHSNERNFKCQVCGKAFKRKKNLNVHVRIYHESRTKYQCDICHKYFTWKRYLIDHLRTHTDERPYVCKVCGQAFHCCKNLNYHTRNTHPKPNQVVSCELCGKFCLNRDKLNRHKIATHSDARNHVCSKCNKSFKYKSRLNVHLGEVHNDESVSHLIRHFECLECKKIFKHKYLLHKHHKAVHEKVKPFECPECHAKFPTKSSLKKHSACHSGITPFTCETCNCKFSTKEAFQIHTQKQQCTKHNNSEIITVHIVPQ